jgi:hypothetical protein
VVAALNPLRAKASLVLPIAHGLWPFNTTRSTHPRAPGVQKFSHEQDIDNRNQKEAESTNIPDPFLQTAEGASKQS